MNMTGKMYKATLKAIWRSPVLWICVCLSLLFLVNEASNYQVASSRTYHKLISNFVLTPIMLEIPIIIGIAAGTDMLRERKNRVLDIIRTKPDVTLRLYIAKILSYITVFYALALVLSLLRFFTYLAFFNGLAGIEYGFFESLYMIAVRWLAYTLPVALNVISITVFTALLFKSTIVSIVSSVFYTLINVFGKAIIYRTWFQYYLYLVPEKIVVHFYYLSSRPDMVEEVAEMSKSTDVLLAYGIVIAVSGVFFVLGGCLFRRMSD